MGSFNLVSNFSPTGDQPEAIACLTRGFGEGKKFQTLLGVTGSGKTFTMANVINEMKLPALVIAHNKTLAAQLYNEFKEFFPQNAVEYFVSYYDYYQPEAYVPSSDTYIEKDSAINDEIDKLRHSATAALSERGDVIIVASVSCIYGLGDPIDYRDMVVSLRPGMCRDRDDILRKLVEIRYDRNDYDFARGTFRARGDTVEVYPAYSNETAVRIEFFGDEITAIREINALTGQSAGLRSHVAIFPASHYVTSREKTEAAIERIERELEERVGFFKREGKLLEAQRINERTRYDIEMMREIGYCSGIENYSRHLSGRAEGSMPYTLIDYFPDDFLMFIDESHVTIPQIRAMYEGDRSRKGTLVEFGFRLPSACDNRPLKFTEFEGKIRRCLFVSATPSVYEKSHSEQTAEQILRPTGLLDPEIFVRPAQGQIDDLIREINAVTERGEKVLITTLTKKQAEALCAYLAENAVRVKYLHSDIETLERLEIIRGLRTNAFDVLVGINLLREGLDIPEVSLIAILDADKEGFLRSETSLIQTVGRAARNKNGRVIMYADTKTDSMKRAISETNRRRRLQDAYNKRHGITPRSISKKVFDVIAATLAEDKPKKQGLAKDAESMSAAEIAEAVAALRTQMNAASARLDFESAAVLRDEINELKKFM